MKNHRKQLEEAEEIAALNLAKFRALCYKKLLKP
jgi:hypothetical protein